jgi:hypothetical protein
MSDPGLEIATEAAKAAVGEIVSPVRDVFADIIGGTVGDQLSNWRRNKPAWRERNERETLEAAKRIMTERGIGSIAEEARPESVEEILSAAAETSAPELKQLYANLIAAAIDPKRASRYRREFVEIVRQLEPLDAVVLPMLNRDDGLAPSRREYIATILAVGSDQIELCFRNLLRLELVWKGQNAGNQQFQPLTTALGKEFLAAAT